MGYVATIGMFDGVHLGHQFVLHHVVETAREQGLQSMAITFDQTMPRDQVLTSLSAKRLLLSKTGIDRIEVLQFTDELRQMTAREFMQQVLRDQLDVKILLTGYDNRFGHNREEGFVDYVRYGQELGIEVTLHLLMVWVWARVLPCRLRIYAACWLKAMLAKPQRVWAIRIPF